MPDSEIADTIEAYLQARKQLIKMGEKYPERISGNDNMIGRIGEFIALRFLESLGQRPKKVTGKSNPGYDLEDGTILTQVKVITDENVKGRNVRLKKPWNQLILIELGEHYKPIRIGQLTEREHNKALEENATWSNQPTVKLTMLSDKGMIGKYGKVYAAEEIEI
ncbi:hypothetical protein [Hydrogenovibrio thermophilus]|uniref:Uncharacterized protein n=1 Tax=Hydrogenovibrio thermophilus TaxID=265883 RepID=A0A410H2J0_9GAMM|nr:hypothetical protein [Hydrogenovibrio thermophilus]QAB15116.1 hypothetical protein EPV75_05245 [Hydrogenovibrio thermophilus]